MCGITGILVHGNEISSSLKSIKSMTRMLHHRGPDDSRIYSDYPIALGHTRLSVIDLTTNAAQPMSSSCGRYTIVYNGEIYNFKELRYNLINQGIVFDSESDTEVLLQCYIKYGKKTLNLVNGIFSFAIRDKKLRKLFAARDPMGVKPFYYYVDRKIFVFASE